MAFSQFKPLPEDIQTLDESEKACQYCGVSYLLLSKYEKMCIHVNELQEGLAVLEKYASERPEILKKLKETQEKLLGLEHSNKIFEMEATQCRKKSYSLESQSTENKLILEKTKHQLAQTRTEMFHLLDVIQEIKQELIESKFSMKNLQFTARHFKSTRDEIVQMLTTKLTDNQSDITSFQKELELMRQENERLSSMYQSLLQSYEASQKFNKQKMEELQNKCTVNEKDKKDQSHHVKSLEARIQDLTNSIQDKESKLIEFQAKSQNQYEELETTKKELYDSKSDWFNKEKLLNDQIANQISTITLLEITGGGGNSPNSKDDALSKKNEQVRQLCDTISRLNKQISDMQSERSKTITAHQNRISQLQEHFKSELEKAIQNASEEEKIQLLESENASLKSDLNSIQLHFTQLQAERKSWLTERHQLRKTNETLQKDIDNIKQQYQNLQQSKARETTKTLKEKQNLIDELQLKLKHLEDQVEHHQRSLKLHQNEKSEQVMKLEQLASEQADKIQFLKQTVRRECEERMSLLSIIEKTKSVNSSVNMNLANVKNKNATN